MNPRLIISASIAFIAYTGWTYYANLGTDITPTMLWRTALLQGVTSGLITLGFTWLTEWVFKRLHNTSLSFAFMTPLICLPYHNSPYATQYRHSLNQILDRVATSMNGSKLTGVLLVPLLPMLLQASIISSIHIINNTPNILLTILPSVIFSGIYGYIYTFSLTKNN